MRKILERFIANGNVEESVLSTLRIKLLSDCPWSCGWCHKEGCDESTPISCDDEFKRFLGEVRQELGLIEAHLTGGEPTMHPRIREFVRTIHDLGFTVKMTTNGQASPELYLDLVDAGLSQLNISLHTLDGLTLAGLMTPSRAAEWGERAIRRQLDLLSSLNGRLSCKINTVVKFDESSALNLAGFVRRESLEWRVMDALGAGDDSIKAIERLCVALGAAPVRVRLIQGSSSYTIVMRTTDGFEFSVKLMRPFQLPSLCANCSVDAAGQCAESFYGLRLEATAGGLFVRSCLYRSGPPFVQPIGDFCRSDHSVELRRVLTAGSG